MTDLERIARANLAAAEVQAAIFDYFHMYLCGRDQLSAIAERIILAAMPEIAAMREEIERLTQYMKGRIEGAEEITRHAVADRDHWKAECERLRQVLRVCGDAITSPLNKLSIVDTIWASEIETLADLIGAELRQP